MATENFHPLPFTFPPITHRGLKESLEKPLANPPANCINAPSTDDSNFPDFVPLFRIN